MKKNLPGPAKAEESYCELNKKVSSSPSDTGAGFSGLQGEEEENILMNEAKFMRTLDPFIN
jgi:hypothetical protein